MMVKIAIDAGHGLHTVGKRTPDGEREWTFNNKVVLALIAKLKEYDNVEVLRVDDATGQVDVPLKKRTDDANAWRADVFVSVHHNAHLGRWGLHSGIETYTLPNSNQESRAIATVIHPLVVKAMGLKDRGLKTLNLHVLRESIMPALLIEGGFMDSKIDIKFLRDDLKLKAQGEAIAEGFVRYFKLKKNRQRIYRIKIDHQQIGAYKNLTTITTKVQKELQDGVNRIVIEKVKV